MTGPGDAYEAPTDPCPECYPNRPDARERYRCGAHAGRCCDHGTYMGNDSWDAECCMDGGNPCEAVTVVQALAHARREADRMREAFRRELDYVLTHGHREPSPW